MWYYQALPPKLMVSSHLLIELQFVTEMFSSVLSAQIPIQSQLQFVHFLLWHFPFFRQFFSFLWLHPANEWRDISIGYFLQI